MTHRLRHLAAATLATAALLGALPAHAIGRLADVNVIDLTQGEFLKVYRHQGEHWVVGRPGSRYAVSVRNTTPDRVMAVVSIDGVNVVSGETASWDQNGYVLRGLQRYDIPGWRKSDAEVAAFHFTASQSSYAERTGRPDHVGVIGVAVFREKPLPPALAEPMHDAYGMGPARERFSRSEAPAGKSDAQAASAAPPPAAAPAASDRAGPMARSEAVAEPRTQPSPAPRLGTGHGERQNDRVGHTTFERRQQRPDELIRIRYDSRENLIAMGVIPPDARPPVRPNPFPGQPEPRYVPDPS